MHPQVLMEVDDVIARPLLIFSERSRCSGKVLRTGGCSRLLEGQEGGSGELQVSQPHLSPRKVASSLIAWTTRQRGPSANF